MSSKDTLPGSLLALADGSEFGVWPLFVGVATCGAAGYWMGAEYFPGTWAPALLAIAGGVLGIVVGVVLAGAMLGALCGALVGAALWYPTRRFLDIEIDALYWWPIYSGIALGGLAGVVVALVSSINTVLWWRQRRNG